MTLTSFLLAGVISLASATVSPGDIHAPFAQEIPTSFVPGKGLNFPPELAPVANAVALECTPDGAVQAVLMEDAPAQESAPHALLATYEQDSFSVRQDDTVKLVETTLKAREPWPLRVLRAQGPDDTQLSLARGALYWVYYTQNKKILDLQEDVGLSVALRKDGVFAVGMKSGLMMGSMTNSSFAKVYPSDSRYSWAPRNVTAVAFDTKGRLWFGSDQGVGMLDNGTWTLYTGAEGLPYTRFTCATPGENGVIWFGTERGAIRFDGTRWDYRASMRWLPDDHVNAIAVQEDGTAWIATRKGIARIERKQMTLAEKAGEYEKIMDERHWRLDFAVRCYFTAPGALETAYRRHTDNDGLYTALYGASQCFRYGATKTPEAKERAKRCFRGLKLLYDVTGIPGFPARSVVPVEEGGEDPNANFGEAANLAMQKEDPLWKNIVPRWPKSADGKYYWKCDTSSDEICGHYFFFGVYNDLVAETPEEKAEVRTLVQALTDHIVDNGFQLVDHDGKPTRWGRWSTDYINTLDGWADRGIQSLEMLSFLNVAHHVTGDAKYRETAKMLRDQHAYHINALWGKAVWPPAAVVPWDGNLAFTSAYGLVKYETDPEILKYYRLGLDNIWLFVSRQNDPFFNHVYASVMPKDPSPVYDTVVPDTGMARAGALQTLKDTPLLLIGWDMANSHRLDVVKSPETRAKPNYGWNHNGQAIPVMERSHVRINSDHFDLDAKGGGTYEYEGSFFLLPYYMGLYHDLLK